jgi:hypothetical protein
MNADARRLKARKRKQVTSRERRPAAARRASRRATQDVLSDPGLMRQIDKSRAFYASGQEGLSFEEVFGEPLQLTRKGRR